MTVVIPQIDAAAMRVAFPAILGECRYMDIGDGWRLVVGQMCVALGDRGAGSVQVAELSQKIGGLRVTMNDDGLPPEQAATAFHAKVLAEERCRFLCEVCGKPGRIHKPPEPSMTWLYCLCPRHLPAYRRGWPLVRRERSYEIDGVHWVYDHLLDRLRVSEKGNA